MTARAAGRGWRIGIDVGGTFTDGIAWNEDDGEVARVKVLSSPDDPGRAFLLAVERLMREGAIDGAAVSYLVHGTTVATNAVLQRRLARVAFITTEGFRDLLEIGRQVRPDPYDVFAVKPAPLVPRQLCFEVAERIAADGSVVRPLADASVDQVVEKLRGTNIEAVAVCLLHAYRNPAHEQCLAARLRRDFPDLPISLSSDLASEFREFPRACTAIINSGLMPTASRYLARLDSQLAERKIAGTRLVMQSNGGSADFSHSAQRPVFLIESGPAAGVVGAAHIAKLLGEDNVISFDMGGTTAKVGLVQNGTPYRVQEFEVGAEANRARGWFGGASGYLILTPAVDLVEIGTGGGSLAWVDDGGKLRVGPISTGAVPGPACYGRQDTQAAITDANLLLGRLNPEYFLGGEMQLDPRASTRALTALGERLGMDATTTASGVLQIADAAMSQALQVVSVQRGYDPRDFNLIAFGGAGPLHAVSIAAEVGIRSVLVPPRPGLASAFGLLVADLKHDFSRTLVQRLDLADPEALEAIFGELSQTALAVLAEEKVEREKVALERALDIRYVGQSYQLTIPLNSERLGTEALAEARQRFNATHRATYGHAEPSEPCEIVNLRISALGLIEKPVLGTGSSPSTNVAFGATAAKKGTRPVFFVGAGFIDCAIYDRLRLPVGAAFHGPAVIEEPDSTTLVHPGWHATVQRYGVLAINRMAEEGQS
jgi:N-methylhydantoinase A